MSNRSSHQRRSRSNRDPFESEMFQGPPSRGGRDPFQAPAPSFYAQPVRNESFTARPQVQQSAERTNVRATVKWFNPEKGFGFVTDETGADLLIHASVVRMAGHDELVTGARLVIDVGRSDRGEKAVALHSVEAPDPAAAPAARPSSPAGAPRRGSSGGYAATPVGQITGTVKWYNADKGFGFVTPDDGSRDVFLHASTLERSGVAAVQEGSKLQAEIVTGRSGKTEIGTFKLMG